MDGDVVIVAAVRTPIGRRNGALASSHSIDILGSALKALIDRTELDPALVGQVVGGCVGQVGMQAMNITRNVWLAAGLPVSVPASTVDAQCGSAQQAANITYSLIRSGVIDIGIASGVEVMSRVTMGSTVPTEPNVGKPINRTYWSQHEFTSQFEAAERIADRWGFTRDQIDELAYSSQTRAAAAWTAGLFDEQIVPISISVAGGEGTQEQTVEFSRDECLRETTLDGLRSLQPTGRPDGVHTAASSSQIADGAAAVLLMTRQRADELSLGPMAVIDDVCLVGCDPVLMLEGPIPATKVLLGRNGLVPRDVGLFEVNEAFASVVLAFEAEIDPGKERVNPNGGALALGHPLGATGVILLTKAVHELQRTNVEHAIVTMCCGGGLGTGTLLRNV